MKKRLSKQALAKKRWAKLGICIQCAKRKARSGKLCVKCRKIKRKHDMEYRRRLNRSDKKGKPTHGMGRPRIYK